MYLNFFIRLTTNLTSQTKLNKNIILSTGASNLNEIKTALEWISNDQQNCCFESLYFKLSYPSRGR